MEFVGEGRYYPTPGTLQIATAQDCVLVDLVAIKSLGSLGRALLDPKITKVLHAGRIDLEMLASLLGAPLTNIFDSQIAAALLGYGEQLSLASLLKTAIGIEVKKEHAFTDWTRRPLSEGQIDYALNDVRHLPALHDFMHQELAHKNRLGWASEEFEALDAVEGRGSADECQLYKNIRGAATLKQSQLDMLRELAAWRELKARKLNLPPSKLAPDEALLELARRPRTSIAQLTQVRGLNPRVAKEYGPELVHLQKLKTEEHAEPIAAEESFPSRWEATVDFLNLCLRSLAEEQSIAPGLIANRSALRELVRKGEAADIRLLLGWRQEAAGNALLGALKGDVSVTISPETKRALVSWGHARL